MVGVGSRRKAGVGGGGGRFMKGGGTKSGTAPLRTEVAGVGIVEGGGSTAPVLPDEVCGGVDEVDVTAGDPRSLTPLDL